MVTVYVAVTVGVRVDVEVGVTVGVRVDVEVGVKVGVTVGAAVTQVSLPESVNVWPATGTNCQS